MTTSTITGRQHRNPQWCWALRFWCAALLFMLATAPAQTGAQILSQPQPPGPDPVPGPAVAAIVAAFDEYEVVAMPEAHGMKDADDFILSLIRNRAFLEKVNDIEVECGNSLYQSILDRYIAGDYVPFTEVRKVWRNTTQPMCGTSEFFEEFFPLVRAINTKLPPGERLRVLAGDPPIDWDQIKTSEDTNKFYDRDPSIAAVMEKEVLSKHRKALMLFGTFHLMHTAGPGPGTAVSLYEKDYPHVTFVISDLGFFDTQQSSLLSSPFAGWPVPSLARIKGTWLGALDLGKFLPPFIFTDDACNIHTEFPGKLQGTMADLVDAVLYLGPQDLRLRERLPADIALDADYNLELQRREALVMGAPEPARLTPTERNQRIVNSAQAALFVVPRNPEPGRLIDECLEHKGRDSPPNN
jgi:hypothetical protein